MEEINREIKKTEQLWQRIAAVAGAFSFVICVLIIVNFFQINREDPVNTLVMDKLVERLNQDPQDQDLREEIRALDLLARKAYFTNQWQIRTGGYLLLIGIAVLVIAWQVILANRKKNPVVMDALQDDLILRQKITRRWIATGGTAVVMTALVFAFLSHRSLEQKFSEAAIPVVAEADVEDEAGGLAGNTQEEPASTLQPAADTSHVEETDTEADSGSQEENDTPEPVKEPAPEQHAAPKSQPAGAVESFTSFRGPGGNGITTQKNIPLQWDGASGQNILWKTTIPLRGFNSPVIWGDRLFLTGADENRREVYGINRNTGEILWTTAVTNVPGSPANPPEVANYTGHSAPTMATDGNQVYAIFSNGDIAALDMEGKIAWSKNLGVPVNHYGYSSSLLVHNKKVVVQYDQKNMKKVLALSVTDGELVWSADRDVKISWASPVIVSTGSRTELILAAEPWVISYNPDTGEEWWRIEGVIGEVGPSVAYADGVVFAVNDYSRLVAIKTGEAPSILWEDDELLSDVPSPLATKDFLIMPTSYGVVACYNAKTGEKYWEHEVDNTIYASPLLTEGKVYLVDKQGVTHIFKADREFVSLGTPELGEKVVCTPAFTNGRIYIRGYDNLYCIGSQ